MGSDVSHLMVLVQHTNGSGMEIYCAESMEEMLYNHCKTYVCIHIYIYIAIWLYRINYIDILKIQGTKSPKSQENAKISDWEKMHVLFTFLFKKKHFEQLTKGTPLNNVHVHPQLKNTLSSLTYQGKSVESKLISIDILIHFLNLKGKSPPIGREAATETRNLDPLAGRLIVVLNVWQALVVLIRGTLTF